MSDVSPQAVIDAGADLADDVEIGPFSVIGPDVRIGAGCRIGPHCVVEGPTDVGAGCVLTSHVSLGSAPQDLKHRGEPTTLEVGARNVFREFVTVNRGTATGGGTTRIGEDNLFMTGAHVAHDCQVGDRTVFANNATLGGHVSVLDDATVGAFCAVHQFCRVGRHAFVGGFTVATKDVLPFMKTVGSRGAVKVYGPNTIGLQRKGFPDEVVDALAAAHRVLRKPSGCRTEALDEIALRHDSVAEVLELIDFIKASREGRGCHS